MSVKPLFVLPKLLGPEDVGVFLKLEIICNGIVNDSLTIHFTLRGGGVQAFQFLKPDFDLWVGGDGLDMYQQL